MKRCAALSLLLTTLAGLALAQQPAWKATSAPGSFFSTLGALASVVAEGRLPQLLAADSHNLALQQQLDTAQEDLLALEDINAVLQQEYRWTEQENRGFRQITPLSSHPATLADCCAVTELVLHFRSNSASIEGHYRDELEALVQSVQQLPGAVIEMSGHSDRRGSDRQNLQLSQQRLESVEAALRELGLGPVVIETTAAGATRPLARTDSDENAFFDRRVELRVRNYGSPLLSSK